MIQDQDHKSNINFKNSYNLQAKTKNFILANKSNVQT